MTRAILCICLTLSVLAIGASSFALWRGAYNSPASNPPGVPPELTTEVQRLQERVRKLEGTPADVETPTKKKELELKWAKATAIEFLDAIRADKYGQAVLLVGSDFKKIYPGESIYTPLSHANSQVLTVSFAITDEQIAPDRDETQFKGTLKGKHSADFCLRLVKEKESEKWRVSFFSWDFQK